MSYTLIGKHEKDKRANRDAYVTAMTELMADDEKIMHVDCDLESCMGVPKLAKIYPDRVVNAGIAEQNAMGIAGGLAAAGMKPFVHSFGCFISRRAFDQAFLAAGYSAVPVHVIGSDPGVSAAFNGATHMPFEDGALYMSIPNAVVVDPCDYAQTYALTKTCAERENITYLRMVRKGIKQVYADGSEFEIGKGVTLHDGNDVAIIASGIMVDEALKACEILESQEISARVIDMFTWKPIDEELILKVAEETGCIVTAENHQVGCGLGSAVSNVLVKNKPVPMEMIGVQNRFGQVGDQEFLMKEYNLLAEDIVNAVKTVIKRK